MLGHIPLCHLLELPPSGRLPREHGGTSAGTKGCLIWAPFPMWDTWAVISWGIPSLKLGGCVPHVISSTHRVRAGGSRASLMQPPMTEGLVYVCMRVCTCVCRPCSLLLLSEVFRASRAHLLSSVPGDTVPGVWTPPAFQEALEALSGPGDPSLPSPALAWQRQGVGGAGLGSVSRGRGTWLPVRSLLLEPPLPYLNTAKGLALPVRAQHDHRAHVWA